MNEGEQALLEFVGGPYDGLLYVIEEPDEAVRQTVELPISPCLISVLSGECPGPRTLTQTVAVYRATCKRGDLRFQFNGVRRAIGSEILELNAWCDAIIKKWLAHKQ